MAKKKRRWWIWVLVILVIATVAYYKLAKRDNAIAVDFGTVSQGTITEVVSGTGSLQSINIVAISSDISGEIVEMKVEEGDTVSRGQVLMMIRPDNYISFLDKATAAFNAQQASVLQSESQLTQSKTKLEKAKIEIDRNKGLFDQKVIAQSDYQTFLTNYNLAKQDLAVATQALQANRYNLESARANVKDAKENLRKTTITSPIDGVIIERKVSLGDRVVGTSQMTGTTAMSVAPIGKIRASVTINENDILKIEEGDTARIQVDAYPDKMFLGFVSSVAEVSTTKKTTDAITEYTVLIDMAAHATGAYAQLGGALRFKEGMTANADIVTNTATHVLRVPLSSVIFIQDTTQRKSESSGKPAGKEVVFIDSASHAAIATVETGLSDFNFIEIKSGLKVSEKIITGPYNTISKTLKRGDIIKDIKAVSVTKY